MKFINKSRGYKLRLCILAIGDVIAINVCSIMALLLRYDFNISMIEKTYLDTVIHFIPINTISVMFIIWFCKLYSSVWSFVSVTELQNIIYAVVINYAVQYIEMEYIFKISLPRSYYILYALFLLISLMMLRFSYRLFRSLRQYRQHRKYANVMIVGAGQSGMLLAKEIQTSAYLNKEIKCFIDDNKLKKGRYLMGVPICGGRQEISNMVKKYKIDEIYVAMPSVPITKQKDILRLCNSTDKKVKILPGMYQLVNGEVSVSKLRDIQIEDLLGRETVDIDMTMIKHSIENKVILVTGGGGSIGSELCRQIATYKPKQLIILDIYENNAYEIQQELLRKYGNELNMLTLIASVRNTQRMENIFSKYRPDIVFHAAAHKHVPLMETSPVEAIKNNVFGTYKTAMAAGKYGTEKFVLISTDKAVNPTNIMGASKRLCEMIVQYFDSKFDTEYVAVRFGNVLGSNGSVIPLFRKQIEEGGPVTVTHKDIIRYFMTIPEAVSLVLQAETYAKGGEIFVLNMGDPVKIDTLARNLIRLSGYKPDVDIKIKYTGLRPGEKLYEELLMAEEGLKETANKLIHIGKPIKMDYSVFIKELDVFKEICEKDEDSEEFRQQVKKLVPTYVMKE